mgnify:CR=1 FL=1
MGKLGVMVIAAFALILSAPAAANPPTRVEEHVDRTSTIPAGAICPFDFVVRSEGFRTTTTFTNSDGSLNRFTIHLTSWHTTYTNPANGKMLRVTFSGPVIVEALPDGRALVHHQRWFDVLRRQSAACALYRPAAPGKGDQAMSVTLFAALSSLVIFAIIQRRITGGMLAGAVKS